MTKTAVVTPLNDLDSIFGAALVDLHFPGCTIIRAMYDKQQDIVDRVSSGGYYHVVFVDYSPTKRMINEISRIVPSITIFDHHPDSYEIMETRGYGGFFFGDGSSSAAKVLSFINRKRLASFSHASVLVGMIEPEEAIGFYPIRDAIDRVIRSTPLSRTCNETVDMSKVKTAKRLLNPNDDLWNDVYSLMPQCIEDRKKMRELAAALVKENMVIREVGGFTVGVVPLVGGISPDMVLHCQNVIDVIIGWRKMRDGRIMCRIRDRHGSSHVIAKYLGGNGHIKAAAAVMSLDDFMNLVMVGDVTVISEAGPVDLKQTCDTDDSMAESSSSSVWGDRAHCENRKSARTFEENSDVRSVVSLIMKTVHVSDVTPYETCELYGGVQEIQTCIGKARRCSEDVFGAKSVIVSAAYTMIYRELLCHEKTIETIVPVLRRLKESDKDYIKTKIVTSRATRVLEIVRLSGF